MENDAETEALAHLELEEADGDKETEAVDHQEPEVVDDDGVEVQAFGCLDDLLDDVGRVDDEEELEVVDDGDVEAEAVDRQELEVVDDDDVEVHAFRRLDELLADVGRVDALLGATVAELNAIAAQLLAARADIEDTTVVDAAPVLPEALQDLVEERRRLVCIAVWLVLVRAVAVAHGRVHLLPGVGLAIVAAQAIVRAASRGAVVVGGMSYGRIALLILCWFFGY